MNFRWLRALGAEAAAPYELAPHSLGRAEVSAHELYAIRIRSTAGQRGLPEPGRGTLILESDLRGRLRGAEEVRPFTPVVLIDGEPAATGFGRADIDLEPGAHLIEVQSGGSAGYWPVEVPDGGFARLTSFASQRGPGRSVLVPTRVVPPRPGRAFTLWLTVAGAGAAMFSTALLDGVEVSGGLLVVIAMTAVMAAGGTVGYGIARLVEAAATVLVALRLAGPLPVARHASESFPGGTWRPIDPRDRSAPEPGAEALLRIALAFAQSPNPPGDTIGEVLDERGVLAAAKRFRLFGEEYPPEARPWVERPRVVIGGESVPAIWGVNEYRLRPGRHRVAVIVPDPPEVLVGKETEVGPGASTHVELELSAGSVTMLEAAAEIAIEPGHDGWELDRYAATLRLRPVSQ